MSRWRRLKRSVAEPVSVPHPWGWALLTMLLGGLAVALSVVGSAVEPMPEGVAAPEGGVRRPSEVAGLVRALIPGWLGDPLAQHGGWAIGAAVGLVLALLALRRALFARLARKPGPVEIAAFTGEVGEGDPSRDEVLAEFRRTLTLMSITTPLSVPTDQPADSLLDDVRTAVDDPKNVLATAVGLVRALVQIRHAYRVSAQLRHRGGPQSHGLTVHVLVRPAGSGETATFWSDDWHDVAEQAANFVGAFVLPRSRLARRPPWTAWAGLAIPAGLFHQSQTAYRLLSERRYEESLRSFHRALKIDPQNPYLRIGLGQVQEQLGLYLDALATYADIVAVESWYDRRLWRRLRILLGDDTVGHPPGPLTRSPNRREALLIARYRLVCRLASAEQLSDQWVRGRPDTRTDNRRRQAERAALRDRLVVWLASYHRLYAPPPPEGMVNLVKQVRTAADFDRFRVVDLSHFLQFVAYCEVMHLVHDYRWASGRRRPGMAVTQTALNIMRVWSPLYLDYASARRSGNWDDWPPPAAKLDSRLHLYLRRKPRWAREWQEYYNAACTFAVALGGPAVPRRGQGHSRRRRELAMHAVRHLERAVSATDSGFVGSYAQWLSTGDQDLNFLRSTTQFRDFLDRYLPNEESRQRRPLRLLTLIMSMHCARLLYQYASMRTDFWESCLEPGPSMATVLDELDREDQARELGMRFAENDRDWLSRVDLIDEALAFSRRHGLDGFSSAFPSFQDDPMIRAYASDSLQGEFVGVPYPDGFADAVVRRREERWGWVIEGFSAARSLCFARESALSVLQDGIIPAMQFWDDIACSLAMVLEPGTPEPRRATRSLPTLRLLAVDLAASRRNASAVTVRSG